jgi:hypothetical protein
LIASKSAYADSYLGIPKRFPPISENITEERDLSDAISSALTKLNYSVCISANYPPLQTGTARWNTVETFLRFEEELVTTTSPFLSCREFA